MDCEAICVRHWDWSETSQTVSLITRDHGLVRCLAKGSKREKSPFSGGLEVATIGQMNAIIRPSSEMVLLTSWDLLDPAYLLRSNLDRYHAAMYAIDLIPRLINDHDPHPELFDAIRMVLDRLGTDIDCDQAIIARLILWYQWVLLGSIGSSPELRADVLTGERLEPGAGVYGFHTHQGGITLDPGVTEQPDIWRVRAETIELLRLLDESGEVGVLSQASERDVGRAGALLALYIRTLVGHEIRSAFPLYPQIRSGN